MDKDNIFRLIKESSYFPQIPDVTSEIFDMLSNPRKIDLDKFTELLSSDKNLSDLFIRSINSGYFNFNRNITSVKETVAMLGIQTVQTILAYFLTIRFFPLNNKISRKFDIVEYWKHCVGTAVASCLLAQKLGLGDKYKLFSYGLFHDIGIAVLNLCLPDIIDEIYIKVKSGVHQIVAERIMMGGLTHSDIGAWLCREWNLREDIVNVVEYHHTPLLLGNNMDDVKIIFLGDLISTRYYRKLLGMNENTGMSSKIMEIYGLTDDDLLEITKLLPGEVEKVKSYYILDSGPQPEKIIKKRN